MNAGNTNNLTDLVRTMGSSGGTYKDKRLPSLAPVSAIPPRVGAAEKTKTATTSTGGGIASPLVETAYANRTYHTEKLLTSTDGFFAMSWKPIDEVHFIDANGAAVTLKYKAPV